MNTQSNLFGLSELIPQARTKHALCGCFTNQSESELKQAAIQKHFLSGRSLTVLQALKQYHTTELRKIVCRLKNKGLVIHSDWFQVEGKNKYKVYQLQTNSYV